jgi:hypothetical protein
VPEESYCKDFKISYFMEARQGFDFIFIFLQEGTVANSLENQQCSQRYPV